MTDPVELTDACGTETADSFLNFVKAGILADLEAALAAYPRMPGEDLTSWYDRVIGDHVRAPAFAPAHAFGLAQGAGIDMFSLEFEHASAEHIAEPEYRLAHALGLAEGAGISMLSEEFETALRPAAEK